jgi:phosphorylcholine metabolism protein LicD
MDIYNKYVIMYIVIFVIIIGFLIIINYVDLKKYFINTNANTNTTKNNNILMPTKTIPPEVLAQLIPSSLPLENVPSLEKFTVYEDDELEYSDKLSVENIKQLKLGQKKMSNMLKEFDRICRKYNFRYFLVGGSVIGALLYKGWIPWDSDVDLEIHEDDYKTFKQVIQQELPENMWFQNFETDKFYLEKNRIVGKIRDLNSCYIEYSNAGFNKWHNGLQIDINTYNDKNGKITMRDEPKIKYLLNSDVYPLKSVPFEDFNVSIMNNSEKYLDKKFGVEWRKPLPKEKRFGHEGRMDGENTCAFHYDKYPELHSKTKGNSTKNSKNDTSDTNDTNDTNDTSDCSDTNEYIDIKEIDISKIELIMMK